VSLPNFRIRCTDTRYSGNGAISHIVRKDGDVYAIAPSGVRASLFYGGIQGIQQEVKFKLEDVKSARGARKICEEHGSQFYTYEVI
jgi:hypothetical protein